MSSPGPSTSLARPKKSAGKTASRRGSALSKRGPAPETKQTVAQMLAILASGGDSRHRKVRRLRAAIKVRAYENDLKLQIAIDRMARRLMEDC